MEPFVYIPVPASLAGAIYQRLAELSAEPAAERTPPERAAPGSLSRDLLERMFVESEPRHRALLAFLAQNPDRWFTTAELAPPLKLPNARSVAGTLGAFGRRANHRYGGALPWESVWDADEEVARHRMPAAVAAVLRDVAAI